ncbi:sodium:proton antiporter [Hallella multisaccharivorax DSM 17128]|uniref:Na+/H+ antiporter NhaC n=1 Tax=Hallella multisaccharivorax DSM 17128 TaxID=688246 RepID=F8N974_9BACT|nr:Na+/H+ antiporter NhaC family protein [Hallella multisaccharivorax]EGN56652.1 Na+/H+ antiporter NhaC [Hallella multisaccharivorax DSM 17128]GJG30190.1 sodium:proton antiporter [Hallella multisaccharivorax DSM 17128]
MNKGFLALSPLIVFISLYLLLSLLAGDFSRVPMTVVFLFASIYAVATSTKFSLKERIDIYGQGASTPNLLLMLWIYVLAGAFAQSAKGMGSIDATVNLALGILPPSMILPGLFIAACFISISIGTSVGTVVTLVPIAAGIASQTGSNVALMTAVIVGGAYFGDNLSFISDTTVVATQTLEVSMKDKFKVNSFIVAPAVIIVLAIYAYMGYGMQAPAHVGQTDFLKVIPYIAVLVMAVVGLNVMAVLALGVLLCGAIGIVCGSYNFFSWLNAMGSGIIGMGELIIIAMMAGGMLEIIRVNGGIDYIIEKLSARVHGKRGAQFSVAALVSLVDVCTANNTVAILTVGNIAKQIGEKYGVDPRKTASILDTFSCAVQGIIPYGVQMLLAAGLAHVEPVDIVPFLYYPFALGIAASFSIWLRYPKRYS